MYADSDALWRDENDHWGIEGSRLMLRGPACDPGRPFVAVLGGSETFGKFVEHPYPALLAERIGMPVANLGVMHAGASLFSKERWLLDIASDAHLTVIQVMGVQNMSNRLYYVHPRRNDRFLASSAALRAIYPEVDFAEINFTGHLLETLERTSEERFSIIVEELRWAWVRRMQRIVSCIRGDVHLLWISERSPQDCAETTSSREPMFVTRAMLDELAPAISGVTEVAYELGGPADPKLHETVANALANSVLPILAGKKGPDPKVEARSFGELLSDQSFSTSSGTAWNRSATRP